MPGPRRVSHNERIESTNLSAADKRKLIHREKTMTIRKETLLMLLLTAVTACAVHTAGTRAEEPQLNKPSIKRSYKSDYTPEVPKSKSTKENKSFDKTNEWSHEIVKANMKKKFGGNKQNTKEPVLVTQQNEEECDSWFSCNEEEIKQIVKNLMFTGAMLALLPIIAIFSQVADKIKNGPREDSGDQDFPDNNEEVKGFSGYSNRHKIHRRKKSRFGPK